MTGGGRNPPLRRIAARCQPATSSLSGMGSDCPDAGFLCRNSTMRSFLASVWGMAVGILPILVLVMAFARTGPDEAVSNLSKWAHKAHLRPSIWLSRKDTDTVVIKWAKRSISVLLMVGILAFAAWYNYEPETSSADARQERNHDSQAQRPVAQPLQPAPNQSEPISWGRLLLQAGGRDSIRAISFYGEGVLPMKIKEAYITSDLTQERREFRALLRQLPNDEFIPVNNLRPLPSGAAIELWAELHPPLSAGDFLLNWGKVTVTVIYEVGKYTGSFDDRYMYQQVAGLLPGLAGPRPTEDR
jgi:hypothetical protein